MYVLNLLKLDIVLDQYILNFSQRKYCNITVADGSSALTFIDFKLLKLLKHLSTSRYLDDLLNIDNPYFEGIYPPELQLNKANTSDTEAPFLDLHLSISKGFV